MKLDKLPKDIQTKIRNHEDKIATLNSSELLDYSKCLMAQRDLIGKKVTKHLFKAIDKRTKQINSGQDVKKQCEMQRAIEELQKKRAS